MRLLSALVAFTVLPTASLAAPVFAMPAPTPHAVAPQVQVLDLAGVDPLARALELHGSGRAAADAPQRAVPGFSIAGMTRSFGAAAQAIGLATAPDTQAPEVEAPTEGRPEVLSAAQDTEPFVLAGVTWSASTPTPDAVVHVRVLEDGTWSEWNQLDITDDGPDAGTAEYEAAKARVTTDPLLTDGAEGVQVRLDTPGGAAPEDLKVELIDPGTSRADDHMIPAVPASTAQAADTRPPIITRAQWGADESLRSGGASYSSTIKVGMVHHTASSNNYSTSQAAGQVRAMYAYHTKSNGWSDYGYNFLVDKFGRIYEGRAGGMDRPVQGAHAGGFNKDTFGVAAIGNYETAAAPAVMVDAIGRVMGWKLGLHGRDATAVDVLTSQGGGTSKYPKGAEVRLNVLSGHKDVGSTACPGRNLYPQLSTIRSIARSVAAGTTPRSVEPLAPESRIVGSLDAAAIVGGGIEVRGWVLDPSTRQSLTARVTVDGTTVATTTADIDRPDVGAAFAVAGSRHGFQVTGKVVNSGNRRVCVLGKLGSDEREIGCRQVMVAGGDPVGALDAAAPAGVGKIAVRGWALDADTAQPTSVHFYVDGQPAGSTQASRSRPDIGAVFPASGPDRGFSATVSTSGTRPTVCAYGINVGAGSTNTTLGCRTVSMPADPIGSFDAAAGRPGAVAVSGWALDPDGDGPVTVHVYVDGAPAGRLTAGTNRSDVQAAFPSYGAGRGFSGSVPAAGGSRQVCTYAINRGAGSKNTTLGCRRVDLPTGNPFGSLDSAVTSGATTLVRGWALDPDTAAAAQVHLHLDGRVVASVRADALRGDIGAAFPHHGARHGFEVPVVVPPGRHQLCAYAINTGGGSQNTTLGCTTLTG